MKLWTGYCQSDVRYYHSVLEGFVAFNEHLSVQEVLKMGFKNFIFAHTTMAAQYEGWGSNRHITKSTPVTNTVLTLPKEHDVRGILSNKDKLKQCTLVIDGHVVTENRLESYLCEDCPIQVECLYDSSIRGSWYKCKPPAMGEITKEVRMQAETPQAERFNTLIESMGSDIQYGEDFKGYTFKSVGRCDYTDCGAFQLKNMNPHTDLYLEKEKGSSTSGSKAATTRKFKKEFCPQCFFHHEYRTYYGKPASNCLRYRSGVSKCNRSYCWSAWSLRCRDLEQYVKPHSFMTEDDMMRVVGGIMAKHPESTFKEWIFQGSKLLKDKKGTHCYLLPDIDSDFNWSGDYLICKKLHRNTNPDVISAKDIAKLNVSEQQFDHVNQVPKSLIPVYITVLAVILNRYNNMDEVISHAVAVFTDACGLGSKARPIAGITSDGYSITIGLQYYHHTEYSFSNVKSVFERLDPIGWYYRNVNTPKYFK